MDSMVERLKSAAHRRAAYHRTVREIERMPLHIAQDLGISREDAHKLAREAVYG